MTRRSGDLMEVISVKVYECPECGRHMNQPSECPQCEVKAQEVETDEIRFRE